MSMLSGIRPTMQKLYVLNADDVMLFTLCESPHITDCFCTHLGINTLRAESLHPLPCDTLFAQPRI